MSKITRFILWAAESCKLEDKLILHAQQVCFYTLCPGQDWYDVTSETFCNREFLAVMRRSDVIPQFFSCRSREVSEHIKLIKFYKDLQRGSAQKKIIIKRIAQISLWKVCLGGASLIFPSFSLERPFTNQIMERLKVILSAFSKTDRHAQMII